MRSEFQFIQHIKDRFSLRYVGDDCAVLPKDSETDLVVTTDMLVEDIDFRIDWTSPELLGHKALTVSLSDIAAMGAVPIWATLSIGVPENVWNSDFLDRFYEGWHALASTVGVELVGGDISRTPDKVVVDSMVAGDVPKGTAVLRSGAKPGDGIFVTGPLGGAAGGLRLLETSKAFSDEAEWRSDLVTRHLRPTAGLFGPPIRELGASSMIDLSDGLSSDLSHVCAASGVGATLIEDRIPIDENLKMLGIDRRERLELALNGGEDFELLFTANEKNISSANFERFYRVGEITVDTGNIKIKRENEIAVLQPKGYRHF